MVSGFRAPTPSESALVLSSASCWEEEQSGSGPVLCWVGIILFIAGFLGFVFTMVISGSVPVIVFSCVTFLCVTVVLLGLWLFAWGIYLGFRLRRILSVLACGDYVIASCECIRLYCGFPSAGTSKVTCCLTVSVLGSDLELSFGVSPDLFSGSGIELLSGITQDLDSVSISSDLYVVHSGSLGYYLVTPSGLRSVCR